jgi:plastocyanin
MFTKNAKFWLALSILLSLFALGSACKGKTDTEGGQDNAPKTKYSPTGNEGTITGKITYNGTPPAPVKIDTSQDVNCGKANPNLATEDNVVNSNKMLANVFVYIKDGTTADGKKFSDLGWDVSAEPAKLDQKGCHYSPHVLGIQATQALAITNSDPTQHNIHFTPQNNPEWNQSQPNGAPELKHEFKVPEVLVPVKCNQHNWMKAYIAVLRHRLFAVSKEDGSFEIKGVPPGTYTLAAWHEGGAKGTEQTKQIKIDAKGSVTADFAFGGSADSGQKPSLQMMPALELPMLRKP